MTTTSSMQSEATKTPNETNTTTVMTQSKEECEEECSHNEENRKKYKSKKERKTKTPVKAKKPEDVDFSEFLETFPEKKKGYEFYESLGRPKYFLAPMVEQSELPFRLLARKYGTHVCYTPMYHSRIFCEDENYREEQHTSCDGDDNLFVQFCANRSEVALEACYKLFKLRPQYNKNIKAIDLNLGCPQSIAKRGHYGSYLMEEPKLISEIVQAMDKYLPVPTTCKIRIFPDVLHTINYAKMLEQSGCSLLVVHGRTRQQRGHNQGLADWDQIKIVKEHVKSIPVISNGNILSYDDVQKCLQYTACDGVMSAEPFLWNPSIFCPEEVDPLKMAMEYVEFAEKYPVPISMVRSHVFKMCKQDVDQDEPTRHFLAAKAKKIADFKYVINTLFENRKLRDKGSVIYKPMKPPVKKMDFSIKSLLAPPSDFQKNEPNFANDDGKVNEIGGDTSDESVLGTSKLFGNQKNAPIEGAN